MKKIVTGFFIVLLSSMVMNICAATETSKPFSIANSQESTSEDLDPIDKNERECISKTASTYEMNRCSQIAQQSWEKDIQNSLVELKKFLSSEDYKKLQLSQSSWENYKNKDYALINSVISYKQGTMYLNFREGWRTEIVKQRALILREYLNTFKEE